MFVDDKINTYKVRRKFDIHGYLKYLDLHSDYISCLCETEPNAQTT